MDISPRKRSKTNTLNEHTSMTVRDIAAVVGICGLKRKVTPRTDKILIRNSRINQSKASTDLRRDLLDYGVEIRTSTVPKMVLEYVSMHQNYLSWTVYDSKKMSFSDETHLFVQGYKSSIVRRGEVETLLPGHIQQTAKLPPKQMFWGTL
ncbi:HTH_Tnp_Tc3_2 domain-containing protein [Trichonephila clavipes]|nr:HTH_Tnp_Tc3_2 domain-containing protein [Trichonephila clavipes]